MVAEIPRLLYRLSMLVRMVDLRDFKVLHCCQKGCLCGSAVQCSVSADVGVDSGEKFGKLCFGLVALKDG